MTLVRSGPPDEVERLHSHLAALERQLESREREVAHLTATLTAFKIQYRQHVGLLHEELDDLERAIDEAERGIRAGRERPDEGDRSSATPDSQADPLPRYTSDAVRRLFRDVAKAVHPDLARDELARDRRHALMVEANRAYALGDEQRLRSILQAWENSPEAVPDSDPEAARLRMLRRIAQIEERLTGSAAELAELKSSPLWKLKVMVDEASARGKDLVADMVGRLKRDIMVARNRLDAIQSNPSDR